MALESDSRPPSEAPPANWWQNYDATYVTPEALAAVPEMPPVPPVTTFDHPKDNVTASMLYDLITCPQRSCVITRKPVKKFSRMTDALRWLEQGE